MNSIIKNSIKSKVNHSSIFEHFIKTKNSLYFLQIGGFDGVSFDNFFSYFDRIEPEGYIVEPIHDYFNSLVSNTQMYPKINLLQKAIHNSLKSTQIYKIKNQCLKYYPSWIEGCASFNKNNFIKNGVRNTCISTEQVSCITINELLRMLNKKKIDYVQIDCEGYDGQIILDMNIKLFKPKVIKFEYVHLEYSELINVKKKLRNNGYILLVEGNDYIGISFLFFIKLLLS